jgi:8-oxo-dGTP diphosphatase
MERKREEYIAGSLDDIKYVWMITKHNGKFVLSFHRKSQKWDHVGGHVEKDETPLAAAKRELFEETGAIDFDIYPVFDHKAFREDGSFNNGRTYFVNVREFSDLPDGSEMDKIGIFDEIPENFRYDGNLGELINDYKRIEKLASAHFI